MEYGNYVESNLMFQQTNEMGKEDMGLQLNKKGLKRLHFDHI